MQAFRRGIDRRAYVLARAQCGDDDLLQSALSSVDADFTAEYGELPISQWPIRFWTLLLSRKELAQGQSPWPALASISHGPRAALLLRLVAGLDFPHAAQVLSISETTYRFALERGLEQLHAAGFNFEELERLRDSFFDEVKQLPVEVIKPRATPEPGPVNVVLSNDSVTDSDRTEKKHVTWPWIVLVFAVVIAVAVAWWLNPDPQSTRTPKPIALSEVQNAVIHPDYNIISSPGIQTQMEDLAFLSWLAAGAPEESFEVLKSGEISKPQDAVANEASSETHYEN